MLKRPKLGHLIVRHNNSNIRSTELLPFTTTHAFVALCYVLALFSISPAIVLSLFSGLDRSVQ